ncbi:MAG: capsular biosynthesis protein, partial [Pseudomonadota bacterium]
MADVAAETKDAPRVFLFLQGPLSNFYSEIAKHLIDAGETVLKIHICGNDKMDWHHKGAFDYRGTLTNFERFLEENLTPFAVTHIILHGDRRPYHRAAIRWARRYEIEIIATELGYLRPDWMTIEYGGTSTGSHFPNDAETIQEIASKVSDFDSKTIYSDKTLT